ncbi:MAG: PepSY-associated TM helix domain-containing protein [Bacteroidota bacterium]
MNWKRKRIYYNMHLYLGLITGIVVFIVAVTGCCWVFQEEITELIEGERIVKAEDLSFLSLTEAEKIGQTVFPDKLIHGIAYRKASEPIEVIFYEAEPEFYQSVYLNPYSGQILDVKDHREGFFWFVLKGHLYLWLPPSIGTEIMRYSTMIFIIMLISGIVLWWPQNKKARKKRLTFDWKPSTQWKRKSFDLHSIVGFYVSVLALIIAFSGLIMAFNWIYYVTYKAWGGNSAPQFIIPANTSYHTTNQNTTRMDELFPMLANQYPDYESLEFHLPHTDSSSVYVEVSYQKGVYYNSDYRFYDQYTLDELESGSIYGSYDKASLADKVIRMNYDIHVGAIGGIAGKALAFIISLVIASLPVTGFILWWSRRKKGTPQESKHPAYNQTQQTLNQPPRLITRKRVAEKDVSTY